MTAIYASGSKFYISFLASYIVSALLMFQEDSGVHGGKLVSMTRLFYLGENNPRMECLQVLFCSMYFFINLQAFNLIV